jgi:hypothetical protein
MPAVTESRYTLTTLFFVLPKISKTRDFHNSGEASMNREMVLKIVLTLVGLLFIALIYPLIIMMRQEPALSMMLSLYVTLGIFLLLAVRHPSSHRSLIAFAAWSSFAHAGLMGFQAWRHMIAPRELIGVAVFIVIGVVLIVLAPVKSVESSSIYQTR